MPSIVFAEASWYGSLRGTVEFGGGSDARFGDGASRWGIKGSSEVSEGLTAEAHFEHKISTTNAGQPGGRLAYVGLSGGFGSIRAGQLGAAGYNHVGVITANANFYGGAGLDSRHGNALSYAYSSGSVGFQIDLTVDGGQDTGGHIDKGEFGLTVGIGDLGKLAVAYFNQKNTLTKTDVMTSKVTYTVARDDDGDSSTPTVPTQAQMITVTAPNSHVNADGMLTTDGIAQIRRDDDKYTSYTGDGANTPCDSKKTTAITTDDCTMVTAYVYSSSKTTTDAEGKVTTETTEEYFADAKRGGGVTSGGDTVADVVGNKSSHVAFEFGLGGITTHIGHSQKKMNGADKKTKTTHFGARGSLGDTGTSFLVEAKNVKGADGVNSNPWNIGLYRSLGGGASVVFEHGNNDNGDSGSTTVGLFVNF